MRACLALSLGLSVFITACSGWTEMIRSNGDHCPEREASAPQIIETTRVEARDWIEMTVFTGRSGREGLAVLSYPTGPASVQGRTFLYDQALAILWYTWVGEVQTAKRLATTLIDVQMANGAWGFSFQAQGEQFYDRRYVRTGAVAWAAWALAYYGDTIGDGQAVEAALEALKFLDTKRIDAQGNQNHELYTAGLGYHDPQTGQRTLGVPLDFVVTEHQLDIHMVLATFHRARAEALAERVVDRLWIEEEGRFAVGAHGEELDRRRALDAAGGWGALWLLSVGQTELARQSLGYTVAHFGADRYGGYVPYLDEIDEYDPQEEVVFVEGSLGVALAALRLGEPDLARQILLGTAQLGCDGGPGIPYADRRRGSFADTPALAPTIWFLMVEREMRTGKRAPVFLPAALDALQ